MRSTTQAKIYHGLFDTTDFGPKKFDAILSFHVVEHVPNPQDHLARVCEVTKPGGYLLLATPNAASWDRSICGDKWTGYSTGHVNLFSPKSLVKCLERTGWRVARVATVEFPWQMLWSLKVCIKPKKNTPQSAGSNVKRIPVKLGAAILTTFGAITKPVRYLQEKLNGGTEIFIVAQKKNN